MPKPPPMGETIDANIKRKLYPFDVPDHVRFEQPPASRGEGLKVAPTIPLNEVSRDSLNELANRWLHDLYTKAGYSGRKIPHLDWEPEPGIR